VKSIVALALFSTCISLSHAQITFQHIGSAEGLPSNKVFMTCEDPQGFIWIATEGGIARYDGSHIRSYSLDKIGDVRKRSFLALFIDIDPDGNLWLISNSGLLFRYDPKMDRFIYFDTIIPNDDANIYVGAFLADATRLIISSYNGVFEYIHSTKELVKIPEINTTVSSIIKSNENGYFFGARDGIYEYSESLKYLRNLKEEVQGTWYESDQKVQSLHYQSSQSRLWIGLESNGLYVYDLKSNKLRPIDIEPAIDVPIRSITDVGGEKIMIGLDGGGVIEYDLFLDEMGSRFIYEEDQYRGLSSNAIYDISVSSQGILFISTYRGGLNAYNPKLQQFRFYKHKSGEDQSLKNDVVLSLAEPKKDWISFGTDNGISLLNLKTGNWQHLDNLGGKGRNKSTVVVSQAVGSDNELWVGSFTYSLLHLIPEGGRYKPGAGVEQIPTNIRIKKVFLHPNGDLLIGTVNSGLFIYNEASGISQVAIAEALDLEFYSSERVLIVGREGTGIFDLNSRQFESINEGVFNELLRDKVVVSAVFDKQRVLWLGTLESGILSINLETSEIQEYGAQQGIASPKIADILCDQDGDIWVATESGISRISDNEVSNYYASDGLISVDFNRNAGLVASDGQVYFGTNEGVIHFDPRLIRKSNIEKKLVLTDFFLNHERILAGANSVLQNPLNETSEISLAYHQNSFSIGFTSIDFVHPDLGNFSWKLEGFDEEWFSENGQSRATYTNLNAGEYVFKVRLTDQIGNFLTPESSLKMTIDKPIWKSFWALVLYMLITLGMVAFMLYSNRLRIESKNAEERLHFLIEMAHEIKTPLTLIRAPLTDLIKKKTTDKESKESLQVALNSAEKLHKQMMQFLDFRRVNVRKDRMKITTFDLVEFINQKVFAFKVLAQKKGVALNFDESIPKYLINSDIQILDKIVSNLISNAIKYTPEGGQVSISLVLFEKSWKLSVKDTGIGIPKGDQKKIFTLFYRTDSARRSGSTGSGVGLVLASDLARTLGGSVKLVNSNSSGSEFVVNMPLKNVEEVTETIEDRGKPTEVIESEIFSETKFKVLIVEDDPDLRNYEKSQFEHKYQIITAENGEEALKLIQNNLPDLIISDVMMPKMNGRQLCMNLKSNVNTSHIPFILLTGLESKESVQQGLESGADDYIVKPFDFEILSSKVDNLLQTRAAIKQKFVESDDNYQQQYQEFTNNLDQEFLDEVTKMVEENLSDPDLSVIFLCQALGMSRTSFYHKLKSLVGLSPAEFIRTIRLKRARKLLLNPANNISEVAYSTGFSDAKYFSTLFKKYYNQSPSSFISEKRGHPQS